MLSQVLMNDLKVSVNKNRDNPVRFNWLVSQGPAKLLSDEYLEGICYADEVRANRKEAEQYLAGLLGMM